MTDVLRLDTDREARTGDPEVVFGAGKTPGQVVAALAGLRAAHPRRRLLATRVSPAAASSCRRAFPDAVVDPVGRTVTVGRHAGDVSGRVAVVAAGTADLPVAAECATTIEVYGATADLIVDVGVAGLHRLLAQRPRIAAADVVVAVAGLEAALPSVIGGLVGRPLIAVPTSVGYGWHLDGVTAWLACVNSCAPGVLTVNVDNGFGAGVAAARIARTTCHHAGPAPDAGLLPAGRPGPCPGDGLGPGSGPGPGPGPGPSDGAGPGDGSGHGPGHGDGGAS
jgi:NCAIR mutase (PurE)-related protein